MLRILTDTASDITLPEAKEMDVELVKLPVEFAGQEYDQMEDLDFAQFYELLGEAKTLPVTSQPAITDVLPHFEAAKQKKDDVLVLSLSGQLSGSVQVYNIAKEMADYQNITIIDTRQAVMGQRLLVDYACRLRKQKMKTAEIEKRLLDVIPRIRLYGALDTLKYLRKGGRIPKSAEVLGTLMGIKPLIEVQDGAIVMAGKARGHAGAVTGMVRLIDAAPDFDPDFPVYFGYSGQPARGNNFRKLAGTKFHLKNTPIYPVGPVVGTHVGPGAFAICYVEQG